MFCEHEANKLKSRWEAAEVKVAELEAVAAPIIEAAEKNGLSPEELVVRIPTALERIAELEAENASLRAQLEAANRRIAELEAELSECRSGDAVLV